MPKQFVVPLGELEVKVTCRRKKDVVTRVYADGRVHISVPTWYTKADAVSFVHEHASHLLEQVAKRAPSPKESAYREALKRIDEGDVVPLWGMEVAVVFEPASAGPSLTATSGTLTCSLPSEYRQTTAHAREYRAALYEKFLRQELSEKLATLKGECERAVGAKSGRWTVRKMRSRWGSCRIETGNISINLDLATHDPKYLQNVALHEACHLKVPNHGPAFKKLMDEVSPQWRELDRSLEKEGVRLS